MNKITEKFTHKKVLNFFKALLVLLISFSALYGLLLKPMMDKGNRIACHTQNMAEAQQFGQQVIEQNKENEELSQEEVAQQVNALITQRYELNYQLCLRSYGL